MRLHHLIPLLLLLTACAAPTPTVSPTAAPTRTTAPMPTASPTERLILPTFALPTQTPPPATPTAAPPKNQSLGIADALLTAQVTPIPAAPNAIDVNNAAQVTQLWQLGKGDPNALIWSPDGETLAIGTDLGIYLYRASDLQLQRAYPTLSPVQMLAFSPDGKQLAVAADCLEVWDLPEGSVAQRLDFCARDFTALTFSPGGSFLAAGEYGSGYYEPDSPQDWFIWDTKTYTIRHHHATAPCDTPSLLVFVPDGTKLLVSACNSLRIVESATGKEVNRIHSIVEWASSLAILPNGETFLVMDEYNPGRLFAYNFITDEVMPLPDIKDATENWQVSPNGKLLFVEIYDDSPQESSGEFWSLESNQRLAQFTSQESLPFWRIRQLTAFSPDSTRLALLYADHIEIRATETGELLNQLNWDAPITGITFGSLRLQPDSTQTALLISTQNGEIRALNPATRAQIASFALDTNAITAFNLHPNGRLLAAASNIEPKVTMLQVYDVQQKTLVFGLTLAVKSDYDALLDAQALAFSADGTALLAIFDELNNYQPRFYAWELRTAAAIEPASKIWFNLYSPHADLQGHLNEKNLNGGLTLIDLYTGETLADNLPLTENVDDWDDSLFFQLNPNRRYFAAKIRSGILVWDLQQPTEDGSKVLRKHKVFGGDGWWGSIETFAFNPNAHSGRLLASTGYDETLRLWDVGSGALLRTFSDTRRDLFLLCFSGDGRYLAAYGYDGALRLFGIP